MSERHTPSSNCYSDIIRNIRRNYLLLIIIDDHCFTHFTPGPVSTDNVDGLRKLKYFDISGNEFTGHIDVLLFPSLNYVDFSNNKFTTAGFRRFHKSYDTLRVMNISSNLLTQDVSQLFLNIPPTLENCDFSNNNIEGTLPKEFPIKQVLFLAMSNNNIVGLLPDFPNTTPKLKRLKLANNHLTGTIHDNIFKLGDLSVLDLAGNKLSGGIPASIGDLTQLSTLRLSSNSLGQSIPVKLGKLKGRCCLPIAYVLTSQSETTSNVAYTFVTQLWLYFRTRQTCRKC